MNEKSKPSIVALIPARGGSKRIINKNIRELAGKPLISYTIETALRSKVFDDVIVSTDDRKIADLAEEIGASVPFIRPAQLANDHSPDIEWVLHAFNGLKDIGKEYDAYSILRPTSPFRTVDTIKRAWDTFLDAKNVDSLRAVEKCQQHPAKMWVITDNRMKPVLPGSNEGTPWHSTPYQALPEIYVQNASLEIAWTKVVFETNTIAGSIIIPFITEEYEGFDINYPEDWERAEKLIEQKKVII